MNTISVGIIGCGAIGSAIAKYCSEKLADIIIIKAIFDIDEEKARVLKDKLRIKAAIEKSLEDLVKSCDLMVEAASAETARLALKETMRHKKDVLIMSAGGLGAGSIFPAERC